MKVQVNGGSNYDSLKSKVPGILRTDGNRFEAKLSISYAQKGFWKGDGLYLNSQLLQKAITVARRDYKNLRIGFVDVKKAFDSVSHDSLWVACKHLGVPERLILYL